uniref:Uncharacterized protein n=1 Tax=Arundo donax TaxID=35708 RepID=A0A0A9AN34_ARUDO
MQYSHQPIHKVWSEWLCSSCFRYNSCQKCSIMEYHDCWVYS